MQAFISYLLQFGSLNQQQIDLIGKKAESLSLSKNDHFWEAGKMVRKTGFLTEGVIRIYYYNNKAEEITRYFVDENHLILAGNDIDENYIPSVYLQAVTDCKLIVFSKKDWKEIHDTIIGWESIIQKVTAKTHREKIERRSELISQDATARYLDFMEKFPALVNRVPLAHIASYLGVTQSSLSRIRKSLR
ncbi:MAG: Crp/Fnr family transcriptional regulator [Citrobacter freundii]|nr:MAG: Crp/Fnr family transcriptional regulator [Citrobacter freundii]